MAGMKGRSGGHNRLNLAELQRRGTLRPSRHRALLASAAPLAFPAPALPPPVPDAVLDGLQAAGRAIVEPLWQAYAVGPSNERLLHELGVQADRLADIRTALVDAPPIARPSWLRAERHAVALLAALLRQLDLER